MQEVFAISDYKYFFLPYDEAEIGAIEGWLELKAERGFKLTHIKWRFFGFEESSTGKVNYCIHPHTDDACCDIPGWKYVGKLSLYFDIFISEDNNDADKPDIDSACMETALKKQILRYRYGVIPSILFPVLVFMLFIKLSFISGGFIKTLIYYDDLLPMGILTGSICAVILGLLYVVEYIKRKKRIKLLMERRKQPVVKTHRIFEWCLIAIITISFFIIIVQYVKVKQIHSILLDKYTLNIKLPLMEQISPEEWAAAQLTQKKYAPNKIIHCFATEESRYVAPTLLNIEQYGDTVQDTKGTYRESFGYRDLFGYDVNYYEMRNEGLAVRYVEELCRDIDYEKMTAIHVDGFESASYFLKRNYQNRKIEYIVLRSGNIVITAMYYGSGSLLDSVHHFSMAAPN